METVFKVLRDVGLRHMIVHWKDIHVYFILKLILEFLKTKRISYDFSSKDGRISEIPISGENDYELETDLWLSYWALMTMANLSILNSGKENEQGKQRRLNADFAKQLR